MLSLAAGCPGQVWLYDAVPRISLEILVKDLLVAGSLNLVTQLPGPLIVLERFLVPVAYRQGTRHAFMGVGEIEVLHLIMVGICQRHAPLCMMEGTFGNAQGKIHLCNEVLPSLLMNAGANGLPMVAGGMNGIQQFIIFLLRSTLLIQQLPNSAVAFDGKLFMGFCQRKSLLQFTALQCSAQKKMQQPIRLYCCSTPSARLFLEYKP